MKKALSPKLTRVATRIGGGESCVSAFKAEGYAEFSAQRGTIWLKDPRFAAIINQMQQELRSKKMYDCEALVNECDEIIKFGREKGNPMSMCKALEIKAKALGLLSDKLIVETRVDIGSALLEARARSNGGAIPVHSTALTIPDHRARDRTSNGPFD